jgi:hypothetical protein
VQDVYNHFQSKINPQVKAYSAYAGTPSSGTTA